MDRRQVTQFTASNLIAFEFLEFQKVCAREMVNGRKETEPQLGVAAFTTLLCGVKYLKTDGLCPGYLADR